MSGRPPKTHRLVPRRFAPGDAEVILDINTTPLIDVLLVLLVMLIVTIPIQLHAVNLELPVAAPAETVAARDKVQVDIDANSVVHWQGVPVSVGELERHMGQAARQPLPPEIHVRPHRDARYAAFAQVLSATRRHGLNRVAVIGSEQFVR